MVANWLGRTDALSTNQLEQELKSPRTPDQRERIINNMVVGLKGTVRGGCGMQRWSTTKWGWFTTKHQSTAWQRRWRIPFILYASIGSGPNTADTVDLHLGWPSGIRSPKPAWKVVQSDGWNMLKSKMFLYLYCKTCQNNSKHTGYKHKSEE